MAGMEGINGECYFLPSREGVAMCQDLLLIRWCDHFALPIHTVWMGRVVGMSSVTGESDEQTYGADTRDALGLAADANLKPISPPYIMVEGIRCSTCFASFLEGGCDLQTMKNMSGIAVTVSTVKTTGPKGCKGNHLF